MANPQIRHALRGSEALLSPESHPLGLDQAVCAGSVPGTNPLCAQHRTQPRHGFCPTTVHLCANLGQESPVPAMGLGAAPSCPCSACKHGLSMKSRGPIEISSNQPLLL